MTDEAKLEPWRCFHCDEVFTTKETAAEHFGLGNYEMEMPLCIEAATSEMKAVVLTNREMWERIQELERELEQTEYERDTANYTLKQPKFAKFEDIEGRMLAAEAALNAGPNWLRGFLRRKAERDWQRSRRAMERLTQEAEALS